MTTVTPLTEEQATDQVIANAARQRMDVAITAFAEMMDDATDDSMPYLTPLEAALDDLLDDPREFAQAPFAKLRLAAEMGRIAPITNA